MPQNRNNAARPQIRIISLFLAVILLSTAIIAPFSSFAEDAVPVPTDATLRAQLSTIYKEALEYDKSHSQKTKKYNYQAFTSLCALYVNIQLTLLGVNTTIIGGNGNEEFSNYRYVNYSTGGRKVHAYSIKNYTIYEALNAIKNVSNVSTNIMVCFSEAKSTSDGKKYGHVMLVHGIIGNNVYFTDNFRMTMAGKKYDAGEVVVCTISQFATYYSNTNLFVPEGVIWFEDEALTKAVKSNQQYYNPETGGDGGSGGGGQTTAEFTPGQYKIVYGVGMKLRSGPGTTYSWNGVVPANSTIYITNVVGNWGQTYCTLDGKDREGWVCLSDAKNVYTNRIGDLPNVAAERYNSSGALTYRQWYNSLATAVSEATDGMTVTLYGNVTVSSPVTLGKGLSMNAGSYTISSENGAALLVRGGKLTSDKAINLLDNDPFAVRTLTEGKYVYTSPYSIAIKAASLDVQNGIAASFTVDSSNLPQNRTDFKAEILRTDAADETHVSGADYSGADTFTISTDVIPADELADMLDVTARVYKVVNGIKYSLDSFMVCFTPSVYAGMTLGNDDQLDHLLCAVMNNSAAASALTGYNKDKPANTVLPESSRTLTYDATALCTALGAPVCASDTSAHITSTELDTEGELTMKFHSDADSAANLKLLVYSPADYAKLKKQAGKGDVTTLMTEANATKVLTADENGYFSFSDYSVMQYADTYYFRLAETNGASTKYDYVFAMSVTDYCSKLILKNPGQAVSDYCRSVCELSAAARNYFSYTINGGN